MVRMFSSSMTNNFWSAYVDKRRNHGSENLVRANDVVFAVHAFAITALTLLQTFIYKVLFSFSITRKKGNCKRIRWLTHCLHCLFFDDIQKDDAQRLSRVGRTFISMAGIGALIVIILAGTGVAMWIDFMYYLSYVKLVISIIKYVPQASLQLGSDFEVLYNILIE